MGGDTSPEQQYSLRWNDFQSSMLSSFRHLRDEEDFVDVTLACDGCSFMAHKVVLSACSPYFRRLLKANPCQHPIIILKDVQHQEMESLLRFMYNGEVHIGQEHLTDFIRTAQMLQVRGLADVSSGNTTSHGLTSCSTEPKASPASSSHPWPADRPNAIRESALSPPPSKRCRSQGAASVSPNRDNSPLRDGANIHESLLGKALEGGPTLHTREKGNSDCSFQAQSTGDDSYSSDTAISEHGDSITAKTEPSDYALIDEHHNFGSNGNLSDQNRSFPGALLGLQGLGGLLPGPSGMHNSPDNFVSRRSLDMMRVRATDPRPCPKCGKIYRSAHTLRTHLEDKHTICPGYRCVLCGTVAKSRNSLHSHMSRQHRGISTKDLPVLPMPAPFDPDLASRLLSKAGLRVSPAELRSRASPTGSRRSDMKLDVKISAYSGAPSDAGSSICGDNDPEDLTTTHQQQLRQHITHNSHRYNSTGGGHHHQAAVVAAKSVENNTLSGHNLSSKEPYPAPLAPNVSASATGSAILDTYLQFITENSLGMGVLSTEQAAAAMHAAKLAQLNAMGLDKAQQQQFLEKIQQLHNASELMKRNSEELVNKQRTSSSIAEGGGGGDVHNHELHHGNNKDDENDDEECSIPDNEDNYCSEEEPEPEIVKAGGQ